MLAAGTGQDKNPNKQALVLHSPAQLKMKRRKECPGHNLMSNNIVEMQALVASLGSLLICGGKKSQEYLTLAPGSKTSSLEDGGMWDTLWESKTWSLGDRGMYAHFGGMEHSGFPIPACGKCVFWGHLLELVIFSAH